MIGSMTRITFLGTADAFHSGGRRHSSYLLDDPSGSVAVDFGPTSLLAMRVLGLDPRRIHTVMVTHLHGDHVGGLPFLVLDGTYRALRTDPLTVIGPPGIEERFDLLLRAAYGELAGARRAFEVSLRELRPGERTRAGAFDVEAFAADHMDPPHVPLQLRCTDAAGAVVAFTGDTAWCAETERCARGADLLVGECTGLAPPIGRHLTWADWVRALPSLGVRRVILSHLGADVRAAAAELAERAPRGVELRFADDGLVVEVAPPLPPAAAAAARPGAV